MSEVIVEVAKGVVEGMLKALKKPTIEGIIFDQNKQPIPNVTVSIDDREDKTTLTGKFILHNLKAGNHKISLTLPNGKKIENVDQVIAENGERVKLDITLPSIEDESANAPASDSTDNEALPLDTEDEVESEEELDSPPEGTTATGPTRFARKYILNQAEELQTLIYAVIKGLPASVSYHGTRDGKGELTLRQSQNTYWEVYLTARPRKKTLEIIFCAEDYATISGQEEGETYGDKLRTFNCPKLKLKHPSWGDFLNCELNPASNEDEIEAVRCAINWFLVESYKLYCDEE